MFFFDFHKVSVSDSSIYSLFKRSRSRSRHKIQIWQISAPCQTYDIKSNVSIDKTEHTLTQDLLKMSLRHIIIHCITLTFSKFLFICENQSDCEVLSDYGVHLCIKHQCIADDYVDATVTATALLFTATTTSSSTRYSSIFNADEYVEATMSATTATLPVTPTTVSSRASFVIVSSSRTSSVTVTLSKTRYSTIPTASSILSTTPALSPSTLPSVQTLSAVRNETLSPLLSNSTLTSMQTLSSVRNVTSAAASARASMKSLYLKVGAVCCLIVTLSVLMNVIVCFLKKKDSLII